MKFLVFLSTLFLNLTTLAEDGLFTRFVFEKHKIGSSSKQSYNTGFLAAFNSSHTVDIAKLYELSITNKLLESGAVNIYLSLKDISSGKPYNVGANADNFVIGEQRVFEFTNNGFNYNVLIDTSYSKLP